jgi:hypothetical protein
MSELRPGIVALGVARSFALDATIATAAWQ